MTLTTPPVQIVERLETGEDSPASGGQRRRMPTPMMFIVAGVVLAVGYLALVPLGYLLWGTFFGADGIDVSGFGRAYGNDRIG